MIYTEYDGSSLYGNFRTRTFSNVFGDFETFKKEWENTPFPALIQEKLELEVIFMLLYSYYGNSSVAASDENRFKYKLFSIIFSKAPAWQKEVQIQNEIRNLDLKEFQKGTKSTVNNATNPSTEPSTVDTEELPYVNTQNVSKTERSKADGYALLISLLKENETEKFMNSFQNLFLKIVMPERPLWYVNYVEEEEE